MKSFFRSLLPVAIAAVSVCSPALRADTPRQIRAVPDEPVERVEKKGVRDQLDQIVDFQKQLDEAMKANDPQKMIELVLKMQQLVRPERGAAGFHLSLRPRPIGDREPPKSELRKQYEKQLKEFADSIEKLKDDKDARAAIETARDEYKKAMEAELKKADLEKPIQPAPRPLGDMPAFPRRVQVQPFLFQQLDFDALLTGRADGAQPRFGVHLEVPSAVLSEQLDLTARSGLVIADVVRGTPAEKAGFKKNDILLQWAGKDLPSDIEGFQARIARANAGEKFEATVLRKGKKEMIKGIELPTIKRADGPVID